jgi:polar amino acid transport system substrate-binding protein
MAAVIVLSACSPAATPTTAPTVANPPTDAPTAVTPATEAPTVAEQPTTPAKVYRVATDATYPPFETVDETTKLPVGFDIDLFNAIAAEEGFKFEFVNVNFDALLAGMAQCQYDAAISATTITDERKKSFNFSDPYINAGQVVTINKETTDIKSVADLKGKRIGVQIGTTGAIEAAKIEGAEVKTYDTVDLAFEDLINKQVDAVVADYPTSVAFIEVNPDKIMTTGDVFTAEEYGIAVCKTNTELLDLINKGLAAVKAKGLIPQLEQKWLSASK